MEARDTPDLRRICQLPTTQELTDDELTDIALQITPHFLTPLGRSIWDRYVNLPRADRVRELEAQKLLLLPSQVEAIMASQARTPDARQVGPWALLGVGEGKTLLMYLLASILPGDRPTAVVPASKVADTRRDYQRLSLHWRAPAAPIEVISWDRLNNPDRPHELCECVRCYHPDNETAAMRALRERSPQGLRPSPLLLDEGDKSKDPKGTRAKRIRRYLKNHPEVRVSWKSGSGIAWSLGDIAHTLRWVLGDSLCPLPVDWQTLEEWKAALDTKTRARLAPGALLRLQAYLPPGRRLTRITDLTERTRREIARGLAERIRRTPGVVISRRISCRQPITITPIIGYTSPETDAAFARFRSDLMTIDAVDVTDPLSKLRYGNALGCDVFHYWDPRPPDWWLQARRAAVEFIGLAIKASARTRHPLDTPKQVMTRHATEPVIVAWREAKVAWKPRTFAKLLSHAAIHSARVWLADGPGLIWTQYAELGTALEQQLGIPYYGAEGMTAGGKYLGDHRSGSAILSVRANARGFDNLVFLHRMLFLGTPPGPDNSEQTIGRLHRRNQTRPVEVTTLINCYEQYHLFTGAIRAAAGIDDLQGTPTRFQLATIDWSLFPVEQLMVNMRNPAIVNRWAGLTPPPEKEQYAAD